MQNKFLTHTKDTREELLKSINLSSIDELFDVIPLLARMNDLDLPEAKSQFDVQKELRGLSKLNKTDYISFLGGGSYNRFVPSAIAAVASRFEFLSAYTPYQGEISQGTLEVMYEFQSKICNLTNMDVSNASVYDGATACAEALLMAVRISKKNKVCVDKNLNPNYLEVIKTYLWAGDIEIIEGKTDEVPDDCAAILYQTPNYYGEIVQTPNAPDKTLLIACVDLTSLALLEPPKVDIMVGDFQPLGIPTSFGGPYGGFMTCKDEYKRQLPGRIVGKTKDKEGKDAYVLTLQAREQHIRREKATSNICSNQALSALCATLYLDLVGEDFVKIAEISAQNAHTLADGLIKGGYEILNNEFVNEFVLKVDNADKFLDYMKKQNILAGIKIDDNKILVAATELNSTEDIELYIKCAQGACVNSSAL